MIKELTKERREKLIDTARHMITRKPTSPESEYLRDIAQIALSAMLTHTNSSQRIERSLEHVADVVTWSSPNHPGRSCDIRWRRFDVPPGPLYAVLDND